MNSIYNWLKAAHVLAVIVWLGGSFAMSTLAMRIGRTGDRNSLAAFLRAAAFYGPRVAGGGSIVALLAGVTMVLVSHLGFKPLWIGIGLTGMLIHFIVGGGLLPRRADALEKLVSDSAATESQIAALRDRFMTLVLFYQVVLVVVVVAMVVKPTM